uniref:RZ-type domain-containing protein n=1 Tax=Rhizophagus irregularis (strain DAOM 181602 / DAOM 197198 / MUCL 43194) TaxID=747089 RepID=U9UXQ3_RHIID
MLILQCDLTTVNTGCIKLAKFIIEQFRNEYISKRDQMERDMPTKHACIILHIHRDQESTFTSFNFMCGWKQMTIETLSGSDVPTSGLLDGSLTRIVNSTYPFEKILQQELLWCLSCMKYPSNDKSINHIKTLNEKILKHPIFIECLKKRVLEWAEENSTSDWQYKIASNKQNLYPYPSFSAALQAHVRTLFRTPIARILCALERLSAIKTFFYVSDQTKSKKGNYEKLLKFWEQIYVDEKIIKIEDIQNPKPDGYNMPAGSLLDLEFPFSFYYMKQIDSFKRHYEEEISMLQKDDDKIDDETNELYDDVIEDHLKDFKNNLLTSIPQLKNSPLEWEWASELYFNDFVTVIASKDGETKNRKMLALILKLLIGADKMRQPIFLHAYWWKNANEVLAQLQLAQMSPIIIKNIENQGNSIVRGSIEKYLVKEVTKLMLQRICGNFEVAENAHLIDKWQHDVTKVLSLVNKITRAKNLPDLQLLRIINDLVATKTIPLESIREIVQLGLSSDEQEVLSEEFINTVIDKLDKLEQNEKNIIPKRSFIMRCLALIPIESDVLLSFYKKLFSNEPFPLMGAIIERVFIKEDLENQDIFFTTLTDFDEAMRQSTRLNIINECLGDLNTNMTTLCCDTIEQSFFMNEKLENLAAYCGSALEALYKQGRPSLQKIVSIALLKEFVRRFWDSFLPKNKNNPIVYDKAEENNFDNEIINQINNILTFSHPLIHSLKIYFLRDLFRRGFSIDDIRRFCEAQKNVLPWLRTFNWEDTKENRLSDNPYCNLPEYNEAENSFMALYSIGNKAPFQTYIQQMKQNMTLTTKLSLMGLLFVRLHALRASREWRHSEVQSADFLTKEITGMNLSNSFKTIATNILSNKQPLLQIINPEINNTDLILKSVIAHIIAFHASIEPNSSQLAMYLHNLQDCQNKFILTCMSDMESVLLNAINEKVTRYVCKCGFKYFVANCGNVVHASKCPNCGNTIGGNAYNQPAAGNTRLDVAPGGQASNDQVGYIGELVNQDLGHSVRSFPPTTYRMLHLIIHALIGASSPQPALVFLQKNNNIATDSEKYCMDHIRNDWEVLKKLLNCSDVNLALIFHSLISLMMENPPLPNQQTNTSAERMNWETVFHNNYVTPQTKNVNETAANYRMKLNEALTKNKKINLIECEINQTLVMDEQYRSEKLPNLWRTIGIINFDSFRAYYMSDLTRNNDYPFLNIFFKHSKQIELLKHLLPIVKFVQILNAKLGYQLTRQTAKDMNFRQFIEKESNGGENDEIFNSLNTAFNDFKLGWNTVMPFVKRYQCHELPNDKPTMGYNLPVIFGLLEQKDAGIFLCAILYHLIEIQNRFLQEVIEIPPGTCKSLKFLDELTFDVGLPISKTKPVTPNGYCLQSMYLDHARSGNIINFDWDDEILAYSQRNLAIARGEDIVYDLTKIEAELANILVFEKVYIETLPDSQLYLEPFPYHMELFQGCMRILSDIKNLIAQEPIPIEKMNLLGVSSLHYASKLNLDNASELLSSLEILLCFVKRTAAGDGEKSIKEFVLQWMKLSSLYEHRGFSKILDTDLQLKHLVSLYELVEEQVADIKIKYIHEKYKEKLSADMETAIMKSLDLEQQTTTKKVIPAEAFALALKRFMLRFLTLENQKEKEPLYVYLQDSSLNFWPSTVPEELIDELFPENLLLANTYDAYTFTINKIEQTMKKQANFTRNIVNNQTIKSPNNQKEPTASKSTQRRSRKILSKYDAM